MSLPLLLAAAGAAAQSPGTSEVHRFALLVGANDGGAERVLLKYAHQDARNVGAILSELGGVDPTNRVLLLDPDAEGLDAALGQLRERVAAQEGRTEVFFYYSGHSDEEGLMLGRDHFPYAELRADLEALPSDVRVAILDSCASGAIVRAKGGRRVAPFLVDQSNQLDGFAIITSSAADEVAQEADRIGGSYFTHYLATGLRGAADMSSDGRVTLDEAYAFAHQETLARTERSQYGPQHANRGGGLDGQGQLVLTDLQLTSASLVLEETLAGRALIRDDDGDLVAELLKPRGRAVELGLGAGVYEIVFTVPDTEVYEGHYAVATITLTTGASTLLGPDDLTWYDSEESVARGDRPPRAVVTPRTTTGVRRVRAQLAPGLPGPLREGTDGLLFGLAGAGTNQLDGLAMGLGFVAVDGVSSGAALSLGFNAARRVDGAQLTVGVNAASSDVQGVQAAAGVNVAGGSVDGIQAAAGVNIAGGSVSGSQLSAGVNQAVGDVRGFQATAGANVTTGRVSGFQGAGGANFAGDVDGFQGAAGVNFARDLQGFQGTAGVNVARDVAGLQAGTVNVGRDVEGAQIGLVNFGREVKGAQIGLVNFARDVDGVSVGLLSFEKEGRHDLLFYANETDLLNVDFKLGGDHLHTILAAGGDVGRHAWVGIGYGGHATFGERLWMDIDGLYQAYSTIAPVTEFWQEVPAQVVRTRVTVGAQLAPQLALFAGAQMSLRLPVGESRRLEIAPRYFGNDGSQEFFLWPGFLAGVQF